MNFLDRTEYILRLQGIVSIPRPSRVRSNATPTAIISMFLKLPKILLLQKI